ncbi:hypothetical protein ACLOJK_019155 [Asimina triloba]
MNVSIGRLGWMLPGGFVQLRLGGASVAWDGDHLGMLLEDGMRTLARLDLAAGASGLSLEAVLMEAACCPKGQQSLGARLHADGFLLIAMMDTLMSANSSGVAHFMPASSMEIDSIVAVIDGFVHRPKGGGADGARDLDQGWPTASCLQI